MLVGANNPLGAIGLKLYPNLSEGKVRQGKSVDLSMDSKFPEPQEMIDPKIGGGTLKRWSGLCSIDPATIDLRDYLMIKARNEFTVDGVLRTEKVTN